MLLVIERLLGVPSGHSHTQITALKSMLENQRIVFATERGQVPDGQPDIVSAFSPEAKNVTNLLHEVQSDVASLETLLGRSDFADVRAVLVPTARSRDFRMITAWLQNKAASRTPPIYMRIVNQEAMKLLSADDAQRLRLAVAEKRVHIETETFDMVKVLHDRWQLPSSSNLILPCTFAAGEASSVSDGGPEMTISFLGQPRYEKGARLLPGTSYHLSQLLRDHLSAKLLYQLPQNARTRFALRFRLETELVSVWQRLARRKLRCVALPSLLSDAEIQEAMMKTDIFLMPYRIPDYEARGSGIMIDAVGLGRPFVYSQGMGMTEFQSFGNAEAAQTSLQFAQKLFMIMNNYERYRAGSVAAQKYLRSRLDQARQFLMRICAGNG